MAWKFEKADHRVFSRNTLAAVVAQLRFAPILKIDKGANIPEFQDRLREKFPGYSEKETTEVEVNPLTREVTTKTGKQFVFHNPQDTCRLTLTSGAISIENKKHSDLSELRGLVEVGISSLLDVYSPVSPRRFGVRYVNSISKTRIQSDLGADLKWSDLINEKYLVKSLDIADIDSTRVYTEITSTIEPGEMTLRFGMRIEDDELFFFDSDRSTEDQIEFDTIPQLTEDFARDIFSLYMTMPNKRLKEWLDDS